MTLLKQRSVSLSPQRRSLISSRLARPVLMRKRSGDLRTYRPLSFTVVLILFMLLNMQVTPVRPVHRVNSIRAVHIHQKVGRTPDPVPSPLAERVQLPAVDPQAPLGRINRGVVLFNDVIQTAAGPEHVSMVDIDLSDPAIRLGLVLAHDRLVSADEPLSSMANRSGALVGINGDYFEEHGPGRPIGTVVLNGRILQTPTNDSFYAVLGITASGKFSIGPEFFSGSVIDGQASYPLHEVNIYSDIHKGLILITPDLGADISVAGDTVAMLRPVANDPEMFTVQSVQAGATWLPTLTDQDAIIGRGGDGDWLAAHLHAGDNVRVTKHLSPQANLFQAIGGGPVVVRNGAAYYDEHPPVPSEVYMRNPLTAIGVYKDGTHVILAVFDGRRAGPWRSVGMTYSQAGDYMLAHGAYNGMLFDSGGSSELVARLPGQHAVSIISTPSEGSERPVANGLFVYDSEAVSVT